MDPDQSAPTGAVWSGSTLFVFEASNILVDDIHVVICDHELLGLINVSSRTFMKWTHVCASQKAY